ncbi:hypothetical protein KQI49_03085 [Virgibacillus sp. MSJ-26]|uniref:hypothetical protein n=1 Tax=Virgibacillus sp. MSJ-26 TaxID=2841522 RepID=UPI001C1246B2|nr:hypothetical protein [Virgibacillus sp. MSJ-26]MBU5465811.1 hypothetical protein [Virgibacillus sp. MSJ-26]
MNDNAQLRVYVSDKYFPIFHKMTRNGIFTQNSEFFIFCTFWGEKKGKKIPIEKRHELCRAVTFTEYDNTSVKALFLKEFGELSTQKEMIGLAEEYANGGIEDLIETTLKDMVHQDVDGSWHFNPDVNTEQFQLELFDFVLRETTEVPF